MAREKKAVKIFTDQYWDNISNKKAHRPNARELFESLMLTKSQTGGNFELTTWNKQVVYDLCLYFAGDIKFNKRGEDFSLDKGIFLTGPVGVGKTHLMQFFMCNPHSSFVAPTCKSITERFRTNWCRDEKSVIEHYSSDIVADAGHPFAEYLGVCFGDLGTEEDTNNYGNRLDVIGDIIFNRYETKLPFNRTHYTTNLNAPDVKAKYGQRVFDRMKEMVNFITLGAGEKGFR